ncbi:MAG: RNA polymerase sigma factor [Gemmatimonadota bacterium]
MTPTEGDPDRELVEEFLRTRSERRFQVLFRRHTPALLGLVLRVSGAAREEAEDVVQEAWVRAVRGLPGFRWESTLRTWLSGIAIRVWSERARRGRSRPEVGLDDIPEPASPVPDLAVVSVDLERAVRRLDDDRRVVLVLHDVEGFTHEEIGAMLGIEPGTSRSRLHRARRELRQMLNDGDRITGEEVR